MTCKQFLCLLLAVACVLAAGPAVGAAEVDCDSIYCFSDEDFSGDEVLTGICITGLPDSDAGTVMLGTRVIRSGDILAVEQLNQLTFQPLRSEQDRQVCVEYLPIYENRVAPATTMTISIRGKVDQSPVAEDSVLETYKNLANQGKLKATDPEGSELTYTVTRNPKRGQVDVSADGSFTYTPKKNKVGIDSFTYTATDAAGNVSREATVTIQVLKPTQKTFYTDTVGQDCRFAAEWMKNTGLFVGESLGGQSCFQPEKTVTRGEFVTMLIQTLGLRVDMEATTTGLEGTAPTWLKPYLAAANRAGMLADWPTGAEFDAHGPITGAEAALLLQNALDLPVSVIAREQNAMDRAVTVMAENGVLLDAQQPMTRAEAAMALYRVSQLAPTAPGMTVFAGK